MWRTIPVELQEVMILTCISSMTVTRHGADLHISRPHAEFDFY